MRGVLSLAVHSSVCYFSWVLLVHGVDRPALCVCSVLDP